MRVPDPPPARPRGNGQGGLNFSAVGEEPPWPPHEGQERADPEQAKDRLRLYRWHELGALPEPEPLVDDLLDREAMSVIYGPSGCGKTFFALDLAVRVALGWEFFGLASRLGPVVYIAAEPGRGLRRRLEAFARQHLSHDTAPRLEEIPFAILPVGVDLCDPDADTGLIIARITAMFSGGTVLVVIDTLSRAMAGYNENSPEDMTGFVRNCDRIRAETGAHVSVVHHSGKDLAAGSRGHSSLRAATDTEIEVVRDETTKTSTAKVVKQRDREIIEGLLTFRLRPITLRQNSRGKDVTSCVIEPIGEGERATRRPEATGQARVALDLLRKAIEDGGAILPSGGRFPTGQTRGVRLDFWEGHFRKGSVTESDKPDTVRKAFKRAADKLQTLDAIVIWDGWAWIPDKPDNAGH